MSENATIVIGADSFVGSRLIETLKARGHKTYGTTRRRNTLSHERLFFDFSDPAPPSFPEDICRAIIVAGATDYGRCAREPQSHAINVEHTPRLTENLLARGIYVIFVSSNSVFGGEQEWPEEYAAHDACFPYAIQKSLAEKGVLDAAAHCQAKDRLCITRLTKVLDMSTPPLPAWLDAWSKKKTVKPFTDLIFAPISRDYAAQALAEISERGLSGPLHVSGAENINYLDFALIMANALNVDRVLVEPTTAIAQNVEIPFKPRFSGLGMGRTTRVCGLTPQAAASVIEDILKTSQGDF